MSKEFRVGQVWKNKNGKIRTIYSTSGTSIHEGVPQPIETKEGNRYSEKGMFLNEPSSSDLDFIIYDSAGPIYSPSNTFKIMVTTNIAPLEVSDESILNSLFYCYTRRHVADSESLIKNTIWFGNEGCGTPYPHSDTRLYHEELRAWSLGAEKYSLNGWKDWTTWAPSWEEALQRRIDSFYRHFLKHTGVLPGGIYDEESGAAHTGHMVCNARIIDVLLNNKPE